VFCSSEKNSSFDAIVQVAEFLIRNAHTTLVDMNTALQSFGLAAKFPTQNAFESQIPLWLIDPPKGSDDQKLSPIFAENEMTMEKVKSDFDHLIGLMKKKNQWGLNERFSKIAKERMLQATTWSLATESRRLRRDYGKMILSIMLENLLVKGYRADLLKGPSGFVRHSLEKILLEYTASVNTAHSTNRQWEWIDCISMDLSTVSELSTGSRQQRDRLREATARLIVDRQAIQSTIDTVENMPQAQLVEGRDPIVAEEVAMTLDKLVKVR
jgi:hypothetical protein